MTLEGVLQRVRELHELTGASVDASAAASPDAGSTVAAQQFAALLGRAQNQMTAAGTALPTSSPASGLPLLLTSQYGAAPPAGFPAPGAAGFGASYGYGGAAIPAGMYAPNGGYPAGATSPAGIGQLAPWLNPSGDVGARMVQMAQGELGVRESPDGSNNSTQIREYRSATAGAVNTPGPWCAYFVSWLAQQSGAPVGADGKGTGYVPTLLDWGKQTGRFTASGSGAPQPGDIVIFSRGGVPGHTGIVERADGGTVHTIEGNTSNMVARREYGAGDSQIIGYIRPG